MHIVLLGESGFPYGLANIQKTILLGKALLSAGANMTVVNRKGKFNPEKPLELAPEGSYEGIHYLYASGTIYRPKGFLQRNIQKIKGFLQEFSYLWSLWKKNELHGAIISSMNFWQSLLYVGYAKIFKFPAVLLHVEMNSSMQHRTGFFTKINDYLFDNYLVKWVDATLPISEILADHFRKTAPGKPLLKIPTICDFKQFDVPKKAIQDAYFLYCGAMSYQEVAEFTLEAYDRLLDEYNVQLYLLVSGGSESEDEGFRKILRKQRKSSKIKMFSDIPFSELIDLYVNASALLIPLRPSLQDAARFPHKIAEYSATGNPIITTRAGEIPRYFEDGKTALMADVYDPGAFMEKMKFVLDQPELAKKIGTNGKELGLREFNYLSYGGKLCWFMKQLYEKERLIVPERPLPGRFY
jgi:glycosyltransferase involved in cell wall biosynthesis